MIESQQTTEKPQVRPLRKRDLIWIIFGASFYLCWFWVMFGSPWEHGREIGHGDMTIDVAPSDDVIVFNATGTGERDLYLLHLSDMSVTRIAETPDYEISPRFSPDGKTIVYAAGIRGDRADHIFTIRLDGTGQQQLTSASADDTDPCYSPDGSTIAFARDTSYTYGLGPKWDGGGVICVVNADATGERQLTSDDEFAYSPCFSPDGKQVIYLTEAGLFSVPVSGNAEPSRLGPSHYQFAISSNGQEVVFSEGEYSPDHELFVSQVDGSGKAQITHSDNGCFHPVFGSREDRVFFLIEEWPEGATGYPKSSLWSVNTDGTEQEQITDLSLFDDPLNWRSKALP